jgi:dienelactone hydrolase
MLALLCAALLQDPEGLKKSPTGTKNRFRFEYKVRKYPETTRGILAFPEGEGPFPAVVLAGTRMFDGFGELFLQKGYVVIAADLGKFKEDETQKRLKACLFIVATDPKVDSHRVFMYGDDEGAPATLSACARNGTIKAAAITGGGPTRENPAKIAAPILILHGSADGVAPVEGARKLKAALGDRAELKIFDGARHDLATERRKEVFEAIFEFFGRQ